VKFHETTLPGVWLIELEPRGDHRGYLARSYAAKDFAELGLNTNWPECNVSYTRTAGTVRGMHFQAEPHPETKLIRCSSGAIFDVLLDIRPGSPTYGKWEGFKLTASNNLQLYAPGRMAHGFQTLTADTQVSYQMSDVYFAELARGVRQDDQAIAIRWPLPITDLSDRDRSLPALGDLDE
jgi:dTDP-4-dehydrorhamnose 3,5-epimerase